MFFHTVRTVETQQRTPVIKQYHVRITDIRPEKFQETNQQPLLSTPMGVDYVVIGFDMEVQPLVIHNAAWHLCVSAICIDVVSNQLLFAHMP